MLWFFLIFSTLCWGLAEIFYKKGNTAGEKYAHLKTTVFVGFFFGIYAIIILLTQDVSIEHLPANFLRYLPVAGCYIISMICSYFGVRYIEESISDPIENTSCAFVPVLCAIVLHEELTPLMIVAIFLVVIGILGAGLFDKEGRESRKKNFGKKLAIVSITMPFCYMILDAIGTFLDIYYTEDAATSVLVGVTEDNLEHTANCCYELTFLLVAIGILIFLKAKGVKLFDGAPETNAAGNENQFWANVGNGDKTAVPENVNIRKEILVNTGNNEDVISKDTCVNSGAEALPGVSTGDETEVLSTVAIGKNSCTFVNVSTLNEAKTSEISGNSCELPTDKISIWKRIYGQRNKIIAALFETGGQATYLFALSEGTGVAAVILGAGTVIISFVLSRIILREKLTALQYTFIGAIFAGIITLSLIG